MTCCQGPTRCVGCEVDGIPLAGADWITDEWMAQMAPRPPGTAQVPRNRVPASIRVAVATRGTYWLDRRGRRHRKSVGTETVSTMGSWIVGRTDRRSTKGHAESDGSGGNR